MSAIRKNFEFAYDFAINGGAVGTILQPGGISSNALVVGVHVVCLQSLAGAAATVDIKVGATSLLGATPIAAYPTIGLAWDQLNENAINAGIVAAAAPYQNEVFIATPGQVGLVISAGALTAGILFVVVEYIDFD